MTIIIVTMYATYIPIYYISNIPYSSNIDFNFSLILSAAWLPGKCEQAIKRDWSSSVLGWKKWTLTAMNETLLLNQMSEVAHMKSIFSNNFFKCCLCFMHNAWKLIVKNQRILFCWPNEKKTFIKIQWYLSYNLTNKYLDACSSIFRDSIGFGWLPAAPAANARSRFRFFRQTKKVEKEIDNY